MAVHILLVEDEPKLARFLELELQSEGYRVSVAHDGIAGLTAAREARPDLILLDWELPGLSGLEICRRLRDTGDRVPVIFLSGRNDATDRVAGLTVGADDYMGKPFSVEELVVRIRLRLGDANVRATDVCVFGDLQLNRRTRRVQRGERSIELTPREFDLLEYLLRHPRQVVTKQTILAQVWGYDFMGDSNIVEVYVRNLRLKLEKDGSRRLIQTVRGVGYMLADS
jgi:DNA-binding response OmpR family regulator